MNETIAISGLLILAAVLIGTGVVLSRKSNLPTKKQGRNNQGGNSGIWGSGGDSDGGSDGGGGGGD